MNTPSDPQNTNVLAEVFQTVLERKRVMPEHSYVAKLLRSGTDAILCKISEETGELIKASREETTERQVSELCDLFFHTLVLMADRNIPFQALEREFSKRHGISGLDEKASRPTP